MDRSGLGFVLRDQKHCEQFFASVRWQALVSRKVAWGRRTRRVAFGLWAPVPAPFFARAMQAEHVSSLRAGFFPDFSTICVLEEVATAQGVQVRWGTTATLLMPGEQGSGIPLSS